MEYRITVKFKMEYRITVKFKKFVGEHFKTRREFSKEKNFLEKIFYISIRSTISFRYTI